MKKYLIILFMVFIFFACERFVVDESKDMYLKTQVLVEAKYTPKGGFCATSSWQLKFEDGTIVVLVADVAQYQLQQMSLVVGKQYDIYSTPDGRQIVRLAREKSK